MRKRFSLRERLRSFRHAFRGLRTLIKEEHNARIHLAAACVAVAAGIYFRISLTDWLFVVVAIFAVFATEALNAAVENLCDFVSPQWHETIRKAKDLASFAVLAAAIFALVVAGVIGYKLIIDN